MYSQENPPKISVIVPLYNNEAYIKECLESLRKQSFEDFEVICVDDASTDEGLSCAREAVQDDERFRFIEFTSNRGLSVARNTALDQACGEYILLLDSDDYLVPEALEKLYERAHEQDLDDLFYSANSFYESYEIFGRLREDYHMRTSYDEVATGKELFIFFEENDQFYPQAAFQFVKRSFLEMHHIRFIEGILHEDIWFTFIVLMCAEKASFLNEPLYQRRIHGGSIMGANKRNLRNVEGHFVSILAMKSWIASHGEEFDTPLISAATKCIDTFNEVVANDWFTDIEEQDQQLFLANLNEGEKVIFFEEIIHPGARMRALEKRYLDSKTFKVGSVILGIPRWIRARITKITDFFKERK